MGGTRFTRYFIFFILLLSGMIVSCQKDQNIKEANAENQVVNADSANSLNTLNAPGNYLAVKGTLEISILDSTYIFDAANDSIAFVNVHSGDNQYFGITAINKAHNMSFGVSSLGYALSDINSAIAGSQFILNQENKPNVEYALTQYTGSKDFGKISLTEYKRDSVLAKGKFYTFLAKNAKDTSAYKITGTFNLRLK